MKDKLLITEAEFDRRVRPALRLFLSVDLENSTQLKQRRDSDRETWLTAVLLFAKSFPQLFEACLQQRALKDVRSFPSVPPLWKMLGDELLFVQPLQRGQDAHIYIEGFLDALAQWNKDVASGPPQPDRGSLFVKGAAWIAGFPIANAVIDAGDQRADYVGPSIDAGFRIARLATRRHLPVSVDLAWLLLKTNSHLRLHFDGPASLKGMAEESGYPALWLEVSSSPYVQIERELLGYDVQANLVKMKQLCEHFITEFGVPRHTPFLQGDPTLSSKPPGFDTELEKHVEFLRRQIYIVDESAPAAATTKPAAKHTAATPPPTEEALLANLSVQQLKAKPRTAPKKTPALKKDAKAKKTPAPRKRPAPAKRRSPASPKG